MNLAPSTFLARRLDVLRSAMSAAGCGALAVTHRPNVFYLSNFGGSAGLLVVTAARLDLVTDSRYVTEAQRLLASPFAPAATLVPVESSYDESLAALLLDAREAAAGFEANHLTVARYEWLKARLEPAVALRGVQGLIEGQRVVKDAHEVSVLRDAAARLAAVVPAAAALVRAGVAEEEIARGIEAAIRSSGFSRAAFDTIVASGPNGALPHATAGERRLRGGDMVVLDFGGVRDGYCVDVTRTVSVGRAGGEARRVHAAVLAAQAAAIARVRPGVLTGEVDAAARDVLAREGLGAAFGHATGHGLGLELHEAPRIAGRPAAPAALDPARGGTRLEPGMVFTIEPGAYLPGWGGVRIEDDVLVTEDGCEVLTRAGRELIER